MTTTSTTSLFDVSFDNVTVDTDQLYTSEPSTQSNPLLTVALKWFLRLVCISVIILCPWANYKLIKFFQKRPYYKESSSKWYIIFKAVFDTLYMLISIPIIFWLTFRIDIIHRNIFTCKLITYIHYLSDDLISMMLTLLCIDRMIRITCGYRLRKRFSLTLCIIAVSFFSIINIHHIIRLQHRDGFCQKSYIGFWDYEFDIYYSFIYTSIAWTIIFIASINLTVSVYCDRTRRIQLKKQQQQQVEQQKISKIFLNGGEPIGRDSDRLELIPNGDDWEEPTGATIELPNIDPNRSTEQEKQDNIDLELTISVLITAAIFLGCNLPNFIMFVARFVYHRAFSMASYIFMYISLFPLLFSHTISYFIFNHLAARIFPRNSL